MMKTNRTDQDVSAGILSQLILYLKFLQIDEKKILQSCGINPSVLTEKDSRLFYSDYMKIEEAAAKAADDPCFGLHMGEFIEPGHYSIVGYIMMNSLNLSEALIKAGKYYRIMGNMIQAKAEPGLKTVKLHFGIPGRFYIKDSYHCTDSAMTSILSLARKLTGKNINPLKAGLTRERPENFGEYERIFKCPVSFGRKTNFFLFDIRIGQTPVLSPDSQLCTLFENHAAEYLERLESVKNTAGEVEEQILAHMGNKSIGIWQIASNLSRSSRTLQLQLKNEGYTFSQLLRQTRKNLACRYLDGRFSIEEVSYMLGYAQVSIFTKAFRRWTGSTPSEYRKRQRT